MQMFCSFKLSFDVDILAFFCLGHCFGFFKNLAQFFPNLWSLFFPLSSIEQTYRVAFKKSQFNALRSRYSSAVK
jgi:hypothetical protein